MSSDLLEIDDDENRTGVLLNMKASGDAFLSIVPEDNSSAWYHLSPNAEGWEKAQKIVESLQEWIRHTKDIFPENKAVNGTPDMTLEEASSALYDHFGCGVRPHWVQSIGIASLSEHNDTETIHLYLVRKPYPHEGKIPKSWHGFPVKTKVVGEICICGPV